MEELKNHIEAVLFMTGKALSLQEIAEFCGVGSIGTVREALSVLSSDYLARGGALEILEDEGKFKLNIKRQYTALSTKLVSTCELDTSTQATLAVIAYKNPALQSDVIKIRGDNAYDHIKILKDMEFVSSEKHGRTRLLKLAPKFFEYFDVVEQELKTQLQSIATKEDLQKTIVQDEAKILTEEQPQSDEAV